ncbi:hypothetical protein Y695_02703 [Hydrogenophaga sp. T4]|nr:hypothetical protein Y695_02703 [Hydrogenophaga sp. T4]
MERGTFRLEAPWFFSPGGWFQKNSATCLSALAVVCRRARFTALPTSMCICSGMGTSSPPSLVVSTTGSCRPMYSAFVSVNGR